MALLSQAVRAYERYAQVKIFMKKSQTQIRNAEFGGRTRNLQHNSAKSVKQTPSEGDTHSSLNLSIPELRTETKCFRGFAD